MLLLGSDSVALAPFTKNIVYLEEGDSVLMNNNLKFLMKIYTVKEKPHAPYTKNNLDKGNLIILCKRNF